MWSGIQNWIRPFRVKSSVSPSSPPTPTLPRSIERPFQFKRFSKSTMGAKGTQKVDTTQRLADLREQLRQHSVQAFVVPSEDQHSSEYIAHCDRRRAFISGFNGSAGCAVVTLDEAFLFTDGRYFLQAEKQLDKNWKLMKTGLPDIPTWQEFLYKNLGNSTKIGIDATLMAISDAESLKKNLTPKNSQLVSVPNLVDKAWHDRPARPKNPVFHLDVKYSGQSHTDKIEAVRKEMKKKEAKAIVITMLDEVAWLFNLRGSDVDFNPVFFSYAVVTNDSTVLFIDKVQFTEDAHAALGDTVDIRAYDSFFDYLRNLPETLELNDKSKILLGDRASLAVAEAIGEGKYTTIRSPIADLKAIKNATELEGFRQCHIRDGTALIRYFAWLEEQLEKGVALDEFQGAEQLKQFRSELDLFRGLSFETISSTGPNAAIIHYSPDPEDCAIIKKDQIYLCDSGGQYWDGTTDVTRTLHFGTPTDQEKHAFTRVLQGHIALDTAIFPTGTTGYVIDSFARRPLWQDGLDYRHGTGHGVGQYLNVHEGPHGIGVRIGYNSVPLKAGMTVTNEPGYYADGQFGIRIENILLVQVSKTPNNFGDKAYLGFEHVTLCPIHKKLVEISLLSAEERKWLNDYHAEIWEKISPHLKNDIRALKWLENECSPI